MTPYRLRWIDRLYRRAASRFYPRSDGDVVLIGPECFADLNATVVCWQGENYYRQDDAAEDFRRDMALQAYTSPDADYDVIRASLAARIADLCERGHPVTASRPGPTDADRAKVAEDHAAIVREAIDLCWKATPYTEDEDGFIAAYLLPSGVVHRLLGQLQGAGYSAAFRALTPVSHDADGGERR